MSTVTTVVLMVNTTFGMADSKMYEESVLKAAIERPIDSKSFRQQRLQIVDSEYSGGTKYPESEVFFAGLNSVPISNVKDFLDDIDWGRTPAKALMDCNGEDKASWQNPWWVES